MLKSTIYKTMFAAALLLVSLSAFGASVKLSWSASTANAPGSAIVKYNVYKTTTSNAQNTSSPPTFSTTDGTMLTFTDVNVPPGTYFYKITGVAKLADGTLKESALSNESSAPVPLTVVITVPVQQPAQVILP